MRLDALEAMRLTRNNKKGKRFPNREDARYQDGLLFPSLRPRFTLDAPAKVFTIGSCFARNIELTLKDYDVELPTLGFSVPPSEWDFRPNGLLNEYNPGTTSQRILSALGIREETEATLFETDGGFLDLLLPGGYPVTLERAVSRRREIDAVYGELVSSDLVIITLGLVEAWYDEGEGTYPNRMPKPPALRKDPDRYSFRRLDVTEALPLLDRAMRELVGAGVERVLLTVSPVPLGTTFTGQDVVVANSYSKSVLRVCAQMLTEKHPQVDYYPSFELVVSGGTGSFNEDNIHVRPRLVERVTGHMIASYFPGLRPKSEGELRTVQPDVGAEQSA